MENNLFEEKISSREIFKGKILKVYSDVVRLPNNKIATREKVSHPGAVAVVPLNSRNEIILVEQYRYPINRALIEIPAGKLDENELPVLCARRELEEEAGVVDGDLFLLATIYTSPGFSDEKMNIYLAKDFKEKNNNPDDDEFLYIRKIKFEKCLEMIEKGEIMDAKSIIGILIARDYLKKND